ncbi:hypothetical protein PO909_004819 [Leuciscus waleckii]
MGEAGSVRQVRTSRRLARHTARGKTDNLALTDKLSSKENRSTELLTRSDGDVLNSSDLFLVFPVSSEYYRTAQPCARTAGSCWGQRLLSFITAGEVTSVAQDNNKEDEITTADLWDTSVL